MILDDSTSYKMPNLSYYITTQPLLSVHVQPLNYKACSQINLKLHSCKFTSLSD